MALLSLMSCAGTTLYQRKDWQPRWADTDGDCQNTRAEILIQRSLKKVSFTNSKNCTVKTGKWDDYYYPAQHYHAQEVDIDHLVPLFEAHSSGGANWSKEKKRTFANDEDNLVITSKKTNRSKGANTLKTWLPIQIDYACKYYQQWMQIKKKYDLEISLEEVNALDVTKCKNK